MFAFILDPMEILILLFFGFLAVGVPVLVVLLISVNRRSRQDHGSELQADLEEENQRLRDEVARLKKRRDG